MEGPYHLVQREGDGADPGTPEPPCPLAFDKKGNGTQKREEVTVGKGWASSHPPASVALHHRAFKAPLHWAGEEHRKSGDSLPQAANQDESRLLERLLETSVLVMPRK